MINVKFAVPLQKLINLFGSYSTSCWKEVKKQLTGRSPLRRRRSALDCSAISEEEEMHYVFIS